MDKPIYNDRNVYILGAGFSKEFGLPVVNEFLNRMRDSREWLQQQSREPEIKAIDKLFKFRLDASSAAERVRVNLENIEELFSLAAASAGVSLTEDVILAIAATLDYAEAVGPKPRSNILQTTSGWQHPNNWRITRLPSQSGPAVWECSLMEAFMLIFVGLPQDRIEGRHDTIVTLNYDVLPENALYNLGIPFTYGISYESPRFGDLDSLGFDGSARCVHPPTSDEIEFALNQGSKLGRVDQQAIPVLKIHGSVNWSAEKEGVVIHGTYEDVRNSGKTPLLVPPTWRKAMGSPLQAVWDKAVASLHEATNVVIIGYSMPPTDQHFKYLLAAGLQGNISLRQILFVNPAALELQSALFQVLRED